MKAEDKLTKEEEKRLKIIELAGEVVIKEDILLLKELAKY